MAFANKLRELLQLRNMKAVELSRETGLSEGVISEYLSGKKEPRGRQSIAIAKALDVSLDTLWETGFKKSPSSSTNGDLLSSPPPVYKTYPGGNVTQEDIDILNALPFSGYQSIMNLAKHLKTREDEKSSK